MSHPSTAESLAFTHEFLVLDERRDRHVFQENRERQRQAPTLLNYLLCLGRQFFKARPASQQVLGLLHRQHIEG